MEEDIYEAEGSDQISLEDVPSRFEENSHLGSIVAYVMERYRKAEDTRRQDEERWIRGYRNYRGIYGPDVQFTEAEKSRVFIKVTKTKVLAAYGQIIDVLFANNKFPISVDPTILPEGVSASVHFDPQEPTQESGLGEPVSPYGFEGDGREFSSRRYSTDASGIATRAIRKEITRCSGAKARCGVNANQHYI
jgi:hypothetical protein